MKQAWRSLLWKAVSYNSRTIEVLLFQLFRESTPYFIKYIPKSSNIAPQTKRLLQCINSDSLEKQIVKNVTARQALWNLTDTISSTQQTPDASEDVLQHKHSVSTHQLKSLNAILPKLVPGSSTTADIAKKLISHLLHPNESDPLNLVHKFKDFLRGEYTQHRPELIGTDITAIDIATCYLGKPQNKTNPKKATTISEHNVVEMNINSTSIKERPATDFFWTNQHLTMLKESQIEFNNRLITFNCLCDFIKRQYINTPNETEHVQIRDVLMKKIGQDIPTTSSQIPTHRSQPETSNLKKHQQVEATIHDTSV
ncbi:hypothetical protein [Endozoicomonas ascidiicola]|uniref:hypothetical protein n=1 Tax=Endozoicomonas ascidiicola TaxID=1698521 RepID=UPI000829E34D|nr:hypothetical protein [Endozoicomonas ascidiicola]